MADVVEVVLKLLDCVLVALAIRIIHLRPAGDPRFHQLPEMIKWNLFLIPFGALDPLRARADQAHVALEDIPKLRQLIEPQFPQRSSGMRYAGIILPRVKIGRLLVQVAHEHRAELVCRKIAGRPLSIQISKRISGKSGMEIKRRTAEKITSKSRFK